MEKTDNKTVRIGEGILIKDDLAEIRVEILNKIKSDIDSIRNSKYGEDEKPNNFISILGKRGSGKSSMMMTILNELKLDKITGKKIKYVEENYEIDYDFILEKIDPSLFNVEKNALGWIIYSFEEIIHKFKELNKSNQYCSKNCSMKCAIDEYDKLEEYYITSREFYRENLSALSEGVLEYKKVNASIGKADLKLEKQFRKFINEYIKAMKTLRDECDNKEEPLIVISFDDIDIKPQYGPDILDTVINYLCHPNIIVIMSGEEDTFKEALFIELWNKAKVPQQFSTDEIIFNESMKIKISNRVEDILAKVMPARYKYKLEDFSVKDRILFTPYGQKKDTIADVLKRCSINNEDIFLKYFINPMINVDGIINEMSNKFKGIEEGNVTVRSYQGVQAEYNLLKEYSEISNQISNWINTKETKTDSDENKKGFKEIINKSTNIDNIITSLCEVLPATPRGLINFYYKMDEFNKENIEKNRKIEKEKKDNGYSEFGYQIIRLRHIINFKFISALYNILNACNTELKHKKEDLIINKIIEFDEERYKVKFNFTNIAIENGEDYKHNIFNTSKEILMKHKDREKPIEKNESALIQFFYDICKENLLEQYIQIDKDKDFSNIVLYKRTEEKTKIEVCSENLKTFKDYYKMSLLYELSIPLIAVDLKVPRNIRDRLRANMANILEYVMSGDNKKYKVDQEILRIMKNNSYNENIYYKYEKYYGEYFFDNDDSERGEVHKYGLLKFITSYKEKNDFYDQYNYYYDKKLDSIYAQLVSYIFSSKSKGSRIKEISSIIKGEDYKFGNNNIPLDCLYKEIRKFELWDMTENKGYNIESYWGDISLELYRVECLLTVKIIKNIIKEPIEILTIEKIEDGDFYGIEFDNIGIVNKSRYDTVRYLLNKLESDRKKLSISKNRSEIAIYEKINNEVLNGIVAIDSIVKAKKLPENIDGLQEYIDKYEKDFLDRNKLSNTSDTKLDENTTNGDNEEIYFEIIKETGQKDVTEKCVRWLKNEGGNVKKLLNSDGEKENFDKYIKVYDKKNLKIVIINIINQFIKGLSEEKKIDSLKEVFNRIGAKKFFIDDNCFLRTLKMEELEYIKPIIFNEEVKDIIESLIEIDEKNETKLLPESNVILGEDGTENPIDNKEDEDKSE